MDLTPGQQDEGNLRGGGATEEQINAWKSSVSDQLTQGGASPQQVRDYWGIKNFDPKDIKDHVTANVQAQTTPATQPTTKQPRQPIDASLRPVETKDIWDSLAAGWGDGVLSLQRGNKNPLTLSPNASYPQIGAYAIGQAAGDFPASVAGMLGGTVAGGAAGGAAGIAAGTAALPVVGTLAGGAALSTLGATAGAAAGAVALPQAMRKFYMDKLDKGEVTGAKDFFDRMVPATWEGFKGAVTGLATLGAGELAGPLAGQAGQRIAGGVGKALAGSTAKLGAEAVAMSEVSAHLEGHAPEKRDFINTAVSLLGLHAAGATVGALTNVPKKLSNIYVETGMRPEEVADAANNDVTLKQDLATDNPDLPKILNKPEESPLPDTSTIAPKEKAPTTDAATKILSKIGETPDRDTSLSAADAFNKIYAKELDWTSTIKSYLKDAKGGDFLDDNPENSVEKMRIFNAHQDKIREFMEFGSRDFKTGEVNGESYMDVIKSAKKIGDTYGQDGVDVFNAVRLAKRALNYESRGLEHGFDVDAAKQTIADYPEMGKVVDRYVQFRSRLIDYLGDSGRYSKESIQAMKDAAGDAFTPLKRVFEPDPVTGETPSGSKAIKKVVGSDRDVINPIISDMRDIGNMIRMAHETDATNTLIKEVFDPNVPNEFMKMSDNQNGLAGPTQIEGWIDGKRTLYDVPRELKESINVMAGNKPAVSVYAKVAGFVLKPFTVMQRGLTVNNPVFAIAHGWKQQWTAPTLSQTGLKLFQSFAYAPEYLMGKYGVSKEAQESYHNFVYDGGAVNEITKLDKTYLENKIYEYDPKSSVAGRVWNTVSDYSAAAHWAITTHDNIIRYAEYSRMLDQDASRSEAAFAAREVLPDFQKQGFAKSAYTNWIAFLPSHLQGISRAAQAGAGDVKTFNKVISGDMDLGEGIKALGTGYFAKALAMYTTTSLLVKLSQDGDDELNDMNNFQKDNNWVIHVKNWRAADLDDYSSVKHTYPSAARQLPDGTYQTDKGWFLRLPKPFTTGIFFGSGIEHVIDSWKDQNPNGWRDFASAMYNSIIPGSMLPTATQPVLDGLTNYNFYTSKPVVSTRSERFLPEYQYTQYTSETAKMIAHMASFVPGVGDTRMDSAPVIDNAIKTWGGTMGQLAIDQLDKGLVASGVVPDKIQPISKLNKIPFLNRFMVAFPTSNPQSVQDFDERYKKADQVFNTIEKLMKEGSVDEAVKLQDRYQLNMDRLRGVDTALRNMSASIQKIDQTRGLPDEQRQQLEESIMYQMAGMAKQGNALMDEFEKKGKK